jgi:hypothetical protein
VYQFLTSLTGQELAIRQLPAFSLSFVVAALFYRFHSFALECGAFLVTWFVVDAVIEVGRQVVLRRHPHPDLS